MFEYSEAFSRNLGWFSENEQSLLKSKKIAIAGMGGVGGIYLLTCARLGIQNFHISDFDTFELGNFNRQVGSMVSTIGQSKSKTMIDLALDINPHIKITSFDEGINENNVEQFLDGCDFYLDGMDLFEMKVRRLIFNTCDKLSIPAATHAPLGMGSAYMTFDHNSPKFDEFFDFSRYPESLHPILFVVGLAPKGKHMSYMMDFSRVNFQNKKVSSTFMGCLLCAGTSVTEMAKYLLKRDYVKTCPTGYHFDAYTKSFTTQKLNRGNKGILQRLKLKIIQRQLQKVNSDTYPYARPQSINSLNVSEDIKDILDLARWAPSGHNQQPLSIIESDSQDKIKIRIETIAVPATADEIENMRLLHAGIYTECLRIAASRYGYAISITHQSDHTYDVSFKKDNSESSPLADFIRGRFTDRRAYRTDAIKTETILAIAKKLDTGYKLKAYHSDTDKIRFYKLESLAFDIEMVDKDLFFELGLKIDPNTPYSDHSISLESLNLPTLVNWQLRRMLKFPKLMFLLNKIGAHKLLNYIYIKRNSLNSGAYISLESPTDQNIPFQDGQNILRLWLLLTQQGIHLQPNYLINSLISKKLHTSQSNLETFEKTTQELGLNDLHQSIFTARIGYPLNHKVYSRSIRTTT